MKPTSNLHCNMASQTQKSIGRPSTAQALASTILSHTIAQIPWKTEPRKFLMCYEAAIASAGGDKATLTKSLIICLEDAIAN
jgi:hypothetical protein